MSEHWPTERLGRICYIKARIGWRGLSSSEYTTDGPYLIAGQHIVDGRIDWSKCDHISEFRYRESHEIILKEGDVILTKDGTIGRVARVDRLPGDATINGTMMLVRPQKRLDYRYLYHVLNGRGFQKLVDDKVSGSSIPHIFQRDMVNLYIHLPPIRQQAKISETLDTLDEVIRTTEAIIAKFKAMKQGLLHDLLTRGIEVNGDLRPRREEAPELYKKTPIGWMPNDWRLLPFGRLCLSSAFGPRFPSDAYDAMGPLATLRTTDMDDEGNINYGTMPRAAISPSFFADHLLKDLDLVISRSGTCGIAAVFREQPLPVLPGAFLIRFRLSEVTRVEFLRRYFNSHFGRSRTAHIAEGGVQKNLKGSDLLRLLVPVPSIEESCEISARLEAADRAISDELAFLAKLRLQKSGLMDDLLTGRVPVTPLLQS